MDSSKYSKISGQLSLSRKLFRLGYCLEEFAKFVRVLEFPNGLNVESFLLVLRHFVATIYWSLDNIYWMQKMDFYQMVDAKKLNRYRIGFWLVSTVLALQPTLKAYLTARAAVKSDDKKSQQTLTVQQSNVVRVTGDLIVSSSMAIQQEVIPEIFQPHEGLIGLSGVIAGMAGLFSAWETAKTT